MFDFLDLSIKQQGGNIHVTVAVKSFHLAQHMWAGENHGTSPGDGEAVYWR